MRFKTLFLLTAVVTGAAGLIDPWVAGMAAGVMIALSLGAILLQFGVPACLEMLALSLLRAAQRVRVWRIEADEEVEADLTLYLSGRKDKVLMLDY